MQTVITWSHQLKAKAHLYTKTGKAQWYTVRWVSFVSCAYEWGQVHPHRQDIIGVGVHIHRQGKLHIWCLNIVNSSAVHCLYDGPNLRKWQMQGKSWNLKRKKEPISDNLWLDFINVTPCVFCQLIFSAQRILQHWNDWWLVTSFSDSV